MTSEEREFEKCTFAPKIRKSNDIARPPKIPL